MQDHRGGQKILVYNHKLVDRKIWRKDIWVKHWGRPGRERR